MVGAFCKRAVYIVLNLGSARLQNAPTEKNRVNLVLVDSTSEYNE